VLGRGPVFQDFLNISPTSVRRLTDMWACPRTLTSSAGRGNRSSMLILLSRLGGTGTSRTSCLGWVYDWRCREEEGGPTARKPECAVCGMWKNEWWGSYSSCGEGKGYSNREEGSNGVPIIPDGECNLTFVNGRVTPLEPSGIVVKYSGIWNNEGGVIRKRHRGRG